MNISRIGIQPFRWPDNIILRAWTKFTWNKQNSSMRGEISPKLNKLLSTQKSLKKRLTCTRRQECTERLSELQTNTLLIWFIKSTKTILADQQLKTNHQMKFSILPRCGKNQEITIKPLTVTWKLQSICSGQTILKKFGITASIWLWTMPKIRSKT